MDIQEELREVLKKTGAALIGFADMSEIPESPYPYAVSVAIPVPKDILLDIEEGPTLAYKYCYKYMNRKLAEIVKSGEAFLKKRGYGALAWTAEYQGYNESEWKTTIPLKTVATRAGLGWIGRCCLLVTEEFGSAVRIGAIYTDLALDCAEPVNESRCGSCHNCVDRCPAKAVSGALWEKGRSRDEMYEPTTCHSVMWEIDKARFGEEYGICGQCFVVCPYTRRSLDKRLPLEDLGD